MGGGPGVQPLSSLAAFLARSSSGNACGLCFSASPSASHSPASTSGGKSATTTMNSTGECGGGHGGLGPAGLALGGFGLNCLPRLALRALCVAFGDRVLWKAQRPSGS